MKKNILLKIFLLIAYAANVLVANAQAYEFVCKESTKNEGSWTCGLKNSIDVEEDLEIVVRTAIGTSPGIFMMTAEMKNSFTKMPT